MSVSSDAVERRRVYLSRMGIPVWLARDETDPEAFAPARAVAEHEPASSEPSDVPETPQSVRACPTAVVEEAPGWESLEAQVEACRRCPLGESRTRSVFGVGDRGAKLLIIGEAPGAEEDRQGEPFVGRAGQLLNAMLAAIGLARETVYITNILKCRPPRNRDPAGEEISACADYLSRQIELLRPSIILASGRIAAQSLLATTRPIGRLRGELHRHAPSGLPLIATYHPAYLLRSPSEKAKVWQDLKMLRSFLDEHSDGESPRRPA